MKNSAKKISMNHFILRSEDRRSLFIFVGSWCQLESKHPVKQCYSGQLPDLNGGAKRETRFKI